MKTRKEWVANLKNGEITEEMLGACLYSVNKRAKNWRDREWEERQKSRNNYYYYDKYNNEEKCREQKERFYNMKDTLLAQVTPCEIHSELLENRFGEYRVFYKFYKVGGYTFHSPVDEAEVKTKYNDLPQRQLEDFVTHGTPIEDLVSVPFINKVLNALNGGTAKVLPPVEAKA